MTAQDKTAVSGRPEFVMKIKYGDFRTRQHIARHLFGNFFVKSFTKVTFMVNVSTKITK